MTIKLHSLSRWERLPNDKTLLLPGAPGDGERRVRLQVNCSHETALYVHVHEWGTSRLLAVVPAGLETVEFSASGLLEIDTSAQGDQEVWYQTADIEPTHTIVRDPVIFTELAQRRHRNPELEEIMYRMQVNIERRLNQQAEEHQAAIARIARRNDDAKPAPVAKSAGAPDGAGGDEVQPPKPPAAKPGEKAGSKGAGEQPGGGADPAPAGK